jgi:hypothetical protein
MKRLGRLRFLVYAFVSAVLLLGAGYLVLCSSYAKRKLEQKLSTIIGTPVRVAGMNVGLIGNSSVVDLQLFQTEDDADSIWATVQGARADLSAFALLTGNATPTEVTLTGAAIELRFDKNGNLLTRLPEPSGPPATLPRIKVEGGKLTLRQEGHDQPFVVNNVKAEATPETSTRVLNFSGSVNDSFWGDWSITGSCDLPNARVVLKLHADRAEATQEKLKRLPFVPEETWKNLRIDEGVTPVDCTFTVQAEEPRVHYRIELAPRDTRLSIPAVQLPVEKAGGKMVIEDNFIQLREVKGRTAQGAIEGEGDLDFRGEGARLKFPVIRVEGLELEALPDVSPWNKIKELAVAGKLTGQANLDVTVKPNAEPEVTATGKGKVTDAMVKLPSFSNPVKSDQPIEFDFHLRGNSPRVLPLTQALSSSAASASLVPAERERSEGASTGPVLARLAVLLLAQPPTKLGQPAREGPPGQKKNELEANLSFKDGDLAELIKQAEIELPFPVTGLLTINLHVVVPLDATGDVKAYRMNGTATLSKFSIAGLEMTDVRAEVRLDKGVLTLTELKATVAGSALAGRAELRLDGDYPFTGKADLTKFDLETLQQLSPAVQLPVAFQGSLTLAAELSGEARKRTFTAKGSAKTADLVIERTRVDALSFEWEADTEKVRLREVKAKLYEGEVTGKASLPLRETAEGEVDFRVRGVDALALTRAVPAIPVRLEGSVSGSVSATLAGAAPDKPREVTGKVELEAPRLRVQNFLTQRLRGNVTCKAGRAEYKLEGETLGGRFNLEGKIPSEKDEPEEKEAEEPDGRLTIEGVKLNRLGEALGYQYPALEQFSGSVSATLAYRHSGPGRMPVGSGRLTLRGVSYADRAITEEVRAELRLTGRDFQIRDINGLLGEGLLRGNVVLNLRERERSYFNLNVERADAARLLAPLPELADLVQGAVEVSLRGTLGREWRASGSAILTRGRVVGVGVTEWRVPIDLTFAPAEARGQLDVRDSAAQIASGRATGRLSLSWGTGTRLEGSLRFFNADFQGLAARSGSLRNVAVGKVTGRFDFGATDFRTVDDLNGVLEATLAQSQALELPVLNVLVPFVTPGQSATTFQSGDVRARLDRGNFRLQRLALMSPVVQLVVEGRVGLNGRLDLDATAQTSDLGLNFPALRLLARSVPTAGPLPVSLIAQASTLLGNRVIHLRVTGTVTNPSARIDPIALLSEEAVRLFLTRYVLPLPNQSSVLP